MPDHLSAPVPHHDLPFAVPLDWDSLVQFLGGRASTGVEAVEGNHYLRTVRVGERGGWVRVGPAPNGTVPMIRVEVAPLLADDLPALVPHVQRTFDLSADPQVIAARLGSMTDGNVGLRLPGAWDGFEMAVRAILGQQVSVRAASTLSGRFARAFGTPLETPFPSLTYLSPSPERIARTTVDEVAALGIVGTRAKAIIALAQAVVDGTVELHPTVDVERTMANLQALPGIGPWTAQYVAMRALSYPDAFPYSDLGILKALGNVKPKEALAMSEAWRPYRSYAVMHLWRSLSGA